MHNSGSGDTERIACPMDPNHTVLKRDLEKHLQRCNKVLEDAFSARQPFTNKNCNCAEVSSEASYPSTVPPVSSEDMIQWRERLVRARANLVALINKSTKGSVADNEQSLACEPWSPAVTECAQHITNHNWSTRDQIDKHNLQNACILQVLAENDLAPKRVEQSVYVELGCGKAGLTRWLIHSIPDNAPEASTDDHPVFMLLDYEARRNKNENTKEVRSKCPTDNILRLRSNIKDVDLSQFLERTTSPVPDHRGKPKSVEERLYELEVKVHKIQSWNSWPYGTVIGTAKHLCGAATDFGLRCLSRIRDRNVSLVFATCCHHRCDWDQLVNNKALQDSGACSHSGEFKQMITMAGWATTAGVGEDKRTLGRLVKSVIDLSRVVWIIDTFPNIARVEYRKYIEDGITPENFCIVMRSL